MVYGGTGDDLLVLDYSQGDASNVGGVKIEGGYLVRHNIHTNAVIDQLYAPEFERYHITGGSKADQLAGGAGDDILNGGGGGDWLQGGGGKDKLDGGAGKDTADYSDKSASVVVTLNGASYVSVLVGGVVEDRIRNIENLTGGYGADKLTGDAGNNVLDGRSGADTLKGNGGVDCFVFNALSGGVDTISISPPPTIRSAFLRMASAVDSPPVTPRVWLRRPTLRRPPVPARGSSTTQPAPIPDLFRRQRRQRCRRGPFCEPEGHPGARCGRYRDLLARREYEKCGPALQRGSGRRFSSRYPPRLSATCPGPVR